jgi:apolipoprotein N-acyltransferase
LGIFLKFRKYSTTFWLTKGFFIALGLSVFLYSAWLGYSHPLVNTIAALSALYLLLANDEKVWFAGGFWIGVLWFWWIAMSFRYYEFAWAIPIGVFMIAAVYGLLFWSVAYLSRLLEQRFRLSPLLPKATFLFAASAIHPFGFDWFKPELVFVESYLGIHKWQFAIILFALILFIQKGKLFYLVLTLFAYQPTPKLPAAKDHIADIELVTTHITINDKWDPIQLKRHIDFVMQTIDEAADKNKKMVIFPESILPVFLNKDQELLDMLKGKSETISIVMGALKLDETVPRNSTYIFQKSKYIIADKVVLVPFGESNPLPDRLGRWVNQIFYDGAVDYKAGTALTDYRINDTTYRNAICYEACSEKLYEGTPGHMIVLSNNGWFTPSIEPTLQRLLLQYYSKKYGTIFYHSVNMSSSYIIQNGNVIYGHL